MLSTSRSCRGGLRLLKTLVRGGLENVLFTLGLALREGFKVQGAGSFDRFYKHVLGKFKSTIRSYVIFIFIYINGFFDRITIFGPRVYPKGSLVIALVRVCVCPSVFKYLRDRSLVFSETLQEVEGQ